LGLPLFMLAFLASSVWESAVFSLAVASFPFSDFLSDFFSDLVSTFVPFASLSSLESGQTRLGYFPIVCGVTYVSIHLPSWNGTNNGISFHSSWPSW